MDGLGLELAAIIDGVPSGIAVLRERRYVFVNPAMSELSGYGREELLGQTTGLLYASGDDYDRVGREVAAAFAAGEAYKTDLLIRRKDGEHRWMTVRGRLADPADAAAGSVWFMQDITEHKRTEATLRLHELMVSNMQEGLFLVRDSDGIIVYANPRVEAMFGYEAGELPGRNVSCLNAPTARSPEEVAAEIIVELRRSGTWSGEVHNIRKDGSSFWCKASVSAFDHPDHGRVWLAIDTDISKRKLLEEELAAQLERNRELGRNLLAVQEEERRKLSAELHDRTAGNLAAINVLLKDVAAHAAGADDESLGLKLEDIRALMADTTNTVRDISADLRLSLLDFFGMEAVLEAFADRICRRSNISVEVQVSLARPPSGEIQTALYRIAQEAMVNCVKHAGASAINVNLFGAENRIVLTVADNGVGFASETMAGVTGQGVLTMRERTEFAGGSFRIDSAPRRGTTVRVELPYGA